MKELVEDFSENPDDPENHCIVCGELIQVKKGAAPKEGEKYYIVRENNPDTGYEFTEKWIHDDCFDEYDAK